MVLVSQDEYERLLKIASSYGTYYTRPLASRAGSIWSAALAFVPATSPPCKLTPAPLRGRSIALIPVAFRPSDKGALSVVAIYWLQS